MTQVLAVEDDPDIQDMLVLRLRLAGFDVAAVCDIAAALAAARRRRPDVVLLDVQLPGGDGLEFCRRVRADPELAGIGVIVVTASVGDAMVTAAYAAGADEFIPKPFTSAELLAGIRAVAGVRAHPAHSDRHDRDTWQPRDFGCPTARAAGNGRAA